MRSVGAGGSANLIVYGEGIYRIHAFLQGTGSRRPWRVKGVDPARIEVETRAGSATHVIKLTAGAVERTLQEMAAAGSI